ncbi:hypothetical protein PINS_up017215 [Pythium insidiosum]|nr:hypothetical protein PINS_up017215 [Pythium insidiosum]
MSDHRHHRLSSASSMSSGTTTTAAPAAHNAAAAPYSLFLRVHSAERLQLSTSSNAYCKLYLGETPVVNATHSTLSNLFIKDAKDAEGAAHTTFHTNVVPVSMAQQAVVWNQKFQVALEKPKKTVLSIRVKNQMPIYCPSIGACAVALKQVPIGQTVDQSFPLYKGDKPVGSIRLQIALSESKPKKSSNDDGRRGRSARARAAVAAAATREGRDGATSTTESGRRGRACSTSA